MTNNEVPGDIEKIVREEAAKEDGNTFFKQLVDEETETNATWQDENRQSERAQAYGDPANELDFQEYIKQKIGQAVKDKNLGLSSSDKGKINKLLVCFR